ncbi:MAG: TGS domain-containing protein [Thalassobaculum sp.]
MRSIPRSATRRVGAKLNGRLVPLMTQLRNGDQVEIVTSKTSDAVAELGTDRGDRQGEGADPQVRPP